MCAAAELHRVADQVRVVDMGGYSVEFCGGTHLDNTAKVGVFHISSEFSVASGVRRIEATTGLKSLEVMNRNQELLFQAAAALKAKPGELREKAEAIMGEMRQLHQSVEKFKAREAVQDRKSTRLNSSHVSISYAVFCLKKKKSAVTYADSS